MGFHGLGVWVNDDAKMARLFALFDRFPEVERLFLVRFPAFSESRTKKGDGRPEEDREGSWGGEWLAMRMDWGKSKKGKSGL
jgi:hypothetical protein